MREKLGLSIQGILLIKRVYLFVIFLYVRIARIWGRHFLWWSSWVHKHGRQELMFVPRECTRVLEQGPRSYVSIALGEGAAWWMAWGVQLAIIEGHHFWLHGAFSFPRLHLLLKLRVDDHAVVKAWNHSLLLILHSQEALSVEVLPMQLVGKGCKSVPPGLLLQWRAWISVLYGTRRSLVPFLIQAHQIVLFQLLLILTGLLGIYVE